MYSTEIELVRYTGWPSIAYLFCEPNPLHIETNLRFSTHFTSLQTKIDDRWPSGYDTRPDTRGDRVVVRYSAKVKAEVLRYRALAACDKNENPFE